MLLLSFERDALTRYGRLGVCARFTRSNSHLRARGHTRRCRTIHRAGGVNSTTALPSRPRARSKLTLARQPPPPPPPRRRHRPSNDEGGDSGVREYICRRLYTFEFARARGAFDYRAQTIPDFDFSAAGTRATRNDRILSSSFAPRRRRRGVTMRSVRRIKSPRPLLLPLSPFYGFPPLSSTCSRNYRGIVSQAFVRWPRARL